MSYQMNRSHTCTSTVPYPQASQSNKNIDVLIRVRFSKANANQDIYILIRLQASGNMKRYNARLFKDPLPQTLSPYLLPVWSRHCEVHSNISWCLLSPVTICFSTCSQHMCCEDGAFTRCVVHICFCRICICFPAICHIYTCSHNKRIWDFISFSINYYGWR